MKLTFTTFTLLLLMQCNIETIPLEEVNTSESGSAKPTGRRTFKPIILTRK